MKTLFAILVTTALFVSCAPGTTIIMREKVTGGMPPPAIQVDRFLFGKSFGAADILIVADDTETIEPGISYFKSSYQRLYSGWDTEETRNIDYRIQVVTSPVAAMPKNYISRGLDPKLQMAELFDPKTGQDFPIFTQDTTADHREHGDLDPVHPVVTALSDPSFKGRTNEPLFLVYLFGRDIDPNTLTDLNNAIAALQTSRGFFQTHWMTVSRQTAEVATSFPHCGEFSPATNFLSQFDAIPWASKTNLDLCDGNWGNWDALLIKAVTAFKKRMILSRPPFQPETMVLRSGAHLYRFNDDYQWDAKTNEITFLRDPSLQKGDLLEVSYFLKPNDPALGGSPTPPGMPAAPTPNKTKGR